METITSEAPRRQRGPSLWRNSNFMILWSGQTASQVGTGITQTAFPLLVWDLTHSAAQVGLVGALGTLPYLLFSLIAGALVDRWDRKRTMIICDIGRAINLVTLLAALFLGHLTIYQLYLNALVENSFYVFFNLAEVACLPRVVATEQLPAATAQNEATMATMSLISPTIGAVLYSLSGVLPFLADAISYGISVISLSFIRVRFQLERQREKMNLYASIQEGLSWLWRQPLIRYIAFLTGGLNFTFSSLIPVLVVLVKQDHGSSLNYGLILSIGGIGGIIGAIIGGQVQKRFSFRFVIINAVWISAVLSTAYFLTTNPILLGLVTAGTFLMGTLYNVVQFSYRLKLIPDELQGRVNSVFRLMAFGFQPLGWALGGILIQQIGVTQTAMVIAGVTFLLAILTTLNSHVRAVGPAQSHSA